MPRRLATMLASLALILVGIGAAPAAQAAGLPPTNVTAVPGVQGATVTWEYPADSVARNFEVRAVPVDPSLCDPACTSWGLQTSGGDREYVFANLRANVPYTITVSAMGEDRAWGPVVSSNVITPMAKPAWDAPTIAAVGDELELSWQTPDASWPQVTASLLHVLSNDRFAGFTIEPDFDLSTGRIRFGRERLQYGATYSFSLHVKFAGGGTTRTASSNTVRFTPAPQSAGVPQLTLTRSGIKVSWKAPSEPSAKLFDVVLQPGNHKVTENGTSAIFGGLTKGQKYTATVTSRFLDLPSTTSATSAPLTYGTAPVAPSKVTATPGLRSVRLAWTAGNGNGIPVTGYAATCRNRTVTVSATTRAYTFTGIGAGEDVVCSVRTLSALAASTDSPRTVHSVGGSLPLKVGQVSAKPAKRALMVRWARGYSAGTPITGYEIRTNKGRIYRVSASKLGYTIKKLKKNTKITVQVRARNKWGVGPWSNRTRSTKVM